jgi:hypothetical protein
MMTAVIHFLPQWVLHTLDGWSHRVALRRAQERQRKWLARTGRGLPAPSATVYHLKPWRD